MTKMVDRVQGWIVVAVMLLLVVVGSLYVFQGFYQDNKNVTFDIVGVVAGVNATTLSSLHFECIKYCGRSIQNEYMKQCWDQCASLGKEQKCDEQKSVSVNCQCSCPQYTFTPYQNWNLSPYLTNHSIYSVNLSSCNGLTDKRCVS